MIPESSIVKIDALRGRDVSSTRAHAIGPVLDLDADGVPLAIFRARRRVAEIILAAQFIGDPARRGIQIARASDDLGASAAVVGNLAQCKRVYAIVHAASSAPRVGGGIVGRRGWRIPTAATRHRERKRDREARARPLKTDAPGHPPAELALAVDADGIDEYFRLANHSLQ